MILFNCCCAATHLLITFMAPGNNGKSLLLHSSCFGVTTLPLLPAAVLHHLLFVKHLLLVLTCSFWGLVLTAFYGQWQPSCSGTSCPDCFHGTPCCLFSQFLQQCSNSCCHCHPYVTLLAHFTSLLGHLWC